MSLWGQFRLKLKFLPLVTVLSGHNIIICPPGAKMSESSSVPVRTKQLRLTLKNSPHYGTAEKSTQLRSVFAPNNS